MKVLQKYLFTEEDKSGLWLFDPKVFTIVWWDVKEERYYQATPWFMVVYVLAFIIMAVGGLNSFGMASLVPFVIMGFLYSFRHNFGCAAAIVWYGLLKQKLPIKKEEVVAVLALAFFFMVAGSALAQTPYVPPDDVASPTEIGAQITAILKWAPIKWAIGYAFAMWGLGLLMVTIGKSTR